MGSWTMTRMDSLARTRPRKQLASAGPAYVPGSSHGGISAQTVSGERPCVRTIKYSTPHPSNSLLQARTAACENLRSTGTECFWHNSFWILILLQNCHYTYIHIFTPDISRKSESYPGLSGESYWILLLV